MPKDNRGGAVISVIMLLALIGGCVWLKGYLATPAGKAYVRDARLMVEQGGRNLRSNMDSFVRENAIKYGLVRPGDMGAQDLR